MEETGTVSINRVQTAVGTQVRATLTDPDGRITSSTNDDLTADATWQWYRCEGAGNGSGACGTAIASGNSYTPVSADVDKYLVVKATYADAKDNANSAEVNMGTAVLDSDNTSTRPSFTSTTHPKIIAESAEATGTVLSDTELSNLVSGTETGLTFILSGTDASSFIIDAGALKLAPGMKWDHETKSNFSLTINASNPYGQTSSNSLSLTVRVTDVNEAPVITNPQTLVYVSEGATGSIATYSASDPEQNDIFWSLAGTQATKFSISSSGVLSFKQAPSFACGETGNTYNVTVQATDNSNEAVTQAIVVKVENVDDAANSRVQFASAK